MADEHPLIHLLDYGDFGAGKSSLADTFPNPKIVFSFDAFGKDMPYLSGGEVGKLEYDELDTPFRLVTSRKTPGRILKRIEYYHDIDFIEPVTIKRKVGTSIKDVNPSAYNRFLHRMSKFQHEYENWRTAIVDSVTSMEISARRWDQFILNPGAEDARQWYGASKDMLERMLLGRFASLPMNVVVLAHIDDEKYEHQGTSRRMPMAPGKLRGSLPSQYGEVYHHFVDKDGEHWLQTKSDALWACTSAIHAPNPCEPNYRKLWVTP